MVEAVRRCAVCGKAITSTFWFCAGCGTRLGVEGIGRYRQWPQAIREFKARHDHARYQERLRLEYERDDAGAELAYDLLTQGDCGEGTEDAGIGLGDFNAWDRPVEDMVIARENVREGDCGRKGILRLLR